VGVSRERRLPLRERDYFHLSHITLALSKLPHRTGKYQSALQKLWRVLQKSDLEKLFTRFPNVLLAWLARSRLSGSEYRVYFAIVSLTIGWNKTKCRIPLKRICGLTGMRKSHVSEQIKKLAEKGVISRNGKEISLMFPANGTSEKFLEDGTIVPHDRNKKFRKSRTSKSDSSHKKGKKSSTKNINSKDNTPKTGGGNQNDKATLHTIEALAEVMNRAMTGRTFESNEKRQSYIRRYEKDLEYLSHFQAEDVAKGIMLGQAQAEKLNYGLTPKHVANHVDAATAKQIKTQHKRFHEILSFFPTSS